MVNFRPPCTLETQPVLIISRPHLTLRFGMYHEMMFVCNLTKFVIQQIASSLRTIYGLVGLVGGRSVAREQTCYALEPLKIEFHCFLACVCMRRQWRSQQGVPILFKNHHFA